MDTDSQSIPQGDWDEPRKVSEGSLQTSSEQWALINFAHQLYSVASNVEAGNAEESDVRKEARLLMSLSCSSPDIVSGETGRVTPTSDASSCHSSSTKRDSFSFTCPSLSLEDRSHSSEEGNPTVNTQGSTESSLPATLLGRNLKVDDKDALRLQSEALPRNIMQSYQKAIDWRVHSWIESLSMGLQTKERELAEEGASEERVKLLLASAEATLLLTLKEIVKDIKVIDAYTAFKVLPDKAPKDGEDEPPSKRQRLEENRIALEEDEYQYQVSHLLTLQAFLNLAAPGAGFIQIDLQVPGTMTGTFLSIDADDEQLTDVNVEIDTDILASMIEKSSRMVVRAAAEALLNPSNEEAEPSEPEIESMKATTKEEIKNDVDTVATPVHTTTPSRKFSDERVNGAFVVTPRGSSSPSSFGDSDHNDDSKAVLPSIPDNFTDQSDSKLQMLTPQASRSKGSTGMATSCDFTEDTSVPSLVTPEKVSKPSTRWIEAKGKGPNFPFLIEAACAAIDRS